jgi:hypothetical protein
MKNRIIIECKIKLQKMIEISHNIKIKTNLGIFKVIDSLFMVPSLLRKKNCWASLLRKFFFPRFEVCSLQVLYLDKCKSVSCEPLDYDRVWYALQKCLRDPSSIYYRKREKKSFSQKITFLMYFAVASLLGHKFGLASELRKVLLITTIEGLYRRPLISLRNL